MATSINPLSKLFNDLNGELGEEDETALRNLLIGNQISRRDMPRLKDPAAIFRRLEEHGFIEGHDLQFLKDILTSINRRPLVSKVLECEMEILRMKEKEKSDKLVKEDQELGDKLTKNNKESSNLGATADMGLLDFYLSSLQGMSGKMEFMGRTIEYQTKGRFHSLSEPLVFDGIATDIATGIRIEEEHYKTANEAAKTVVKLLVEKLKSQNILIP